MGRVTLFLVLALAGCRVYGDPCQEQMASCLKRCDDSGGTAVQAELPGDSRDSCERDCHRCGPPASTQPAPAGKPTPTGNEPQN